MTEVAAKLGLQLNHSKSEIISSDASALAAMIEVVPDLCPVTPENAHLLGSPIGGEEGIDGSIGEKITALETMGNRLCHRRAHDAYCLLHHSFALPKLLYTLRTSPCSKTPQLRRFDLLLRSLLGEIANINIADNDIAWAQASLPVGSGGLGDRSATQLAPSAFLASAAGCTSITQELLPPRLKDTAYHARDDTLQVWREGLDVSPPLADASRQKAWDAPRVAASFKALHEATQDTSAQAPLLPVSRKESGASSLRLCMEDDVFRVATGLRLGVPICQPHKCQLCGSPVDRQGTHGLHCRKSLGCHPRHSAINDLIKRSLGSAKILAHLEPVGICRSVGKRPDGATVLPWRSGRILVWDATCPDTFAPSLCDLATRGAGAVADQAEERKKAKYAELATTHHFVPLAVETTGVFGSEAQVFFRELGCRIKDESGEPLAYQYLLQRISVAVQRGNAAAVLGTSSPTEFDFIYSQ